MSESTGPVFRALDCVLACICGIVAGVALAVFCAAITWAVTSKTQTPNWKTEPVAPIPADREPIPAEPTAFDGMTALDSIRARHPSRHTFRRDAATDNDLGGVSNVSPNTNIHWRSESAIDSEGATVAGVLEAAAMRLEAIQKTPQADDANARALWDVMKALAALEKLP
jgi:hypothetical protein